MLTIDKKTLCKELQRAHAYIHAQEMVIDGGNTKLVIQNLHFHKTNTTLNKHKNRSKNDYSLLFDGKAQVLSSEEFVAKVGEQAARKEFQFDSQYLQPQFQEPRHKCTCQEDAIMDKCHSHQDHQEIKYFP